MTALLALIKNYITHLYYQVNRCRVWSSKKALKYIPNTTEKLISKLLFSPKIFHESAAFFLSRFFFTWHSWITWQQKRRRPLLTSLYHLHQLCEQVETRRTTATESSFLHIASDRTRTGSLWFPSTRFTKKGKYKALNTVSINKKNS